MIHHQNVNSQQISQNIEEQTAGKLFLRRLFIHSVIKIHKLAGLWVSCITSRSIHETTPNKTENIIIESKLLE